MDQEKRTYDLVLERCGYNVGLVEREEQASTGLQRHLFVQAVEAVEDLETVYFKGDLPFIYFSLLSDFDEARVAELHKRVWNQNRVPLLYVITPGELRIYDAYARPADISRQESLDDGRLIRYLNVATEALAAYEEFSAAQLDSDAFWRNGPGQQLASNQRVDQALLENLSLVRARLHEQGLSYRVVHNLLGRSIFALYLEDRSIAEETFFGRFYEGARSYADVLQNKAAVYQLFADLQRRFNGDLFPVDAEEQETVEATHLNLIREVFLGTDVASGQRALWRPYDFAVIPIELISAVYEEFLHYEDGREAAAKVGAFYTPHPLVEFMMNEVLPWPSDNDSEYDLRVIDPACGSGIFLVEAFRRLVARWKFSHGKHGIPRQKLKSLLTEQVFGVDINGEAVRVAAFSLYLALLDHLEPKQIWQDFQFPKLLHGSGGANLFATDAVEDGSFHDIEYDIVVGNPPWERNPKQASIRSYCQERDFPLQAALPFLWKASELAPNGKIALLGPSSILHNSETSDVNFRRRFFSKNYVDAVVNLSALRQKKKSHGHGVFSSAIAPASIFFYRASPPEQPSERLLYCTPKPSAASNARPEIIIDASEIKFLSRDKAATSDIIWKVALWGTERDFALVERIRTRYATTLGDFIEAREDWHVGRGLQRPGKGPHIDKDIGRLPLMPTKDVKPYHALRGALEQVGSDAFWRPGAKQTYYAPHIMLKRAPYQNRLCAAFADFDCSFKDAIVGIASKDQALLKTLTAYINSSLAAYCVFMTSPQWGVERDRINQNELLSLPAYPMQSSSQEAELLASVATEIVARLGKGSALNRRSTASLVEEVDRLLGEIFDLTESDQMLIRDALKYSLDHFNKGAASIACSPVEDARIWSYAQTFCTAVNKILQFGPTRASAVVYASSSPLRLVSFTFGQGGGGAHVQVQPSSGAFDDALHSLEAKMTQEYGDSIYLRRHVKLYGDESLHVIKPNEARFWTDSTALNDADALLAEGIESAVQYA